MFEIITKLDVKLFDEMKKRQQLLQAAIQN